MLHTCGNICMTCSVTFSRGVTLKVNIYMMFSMMFSPGVTFKLNFVFIGMRGFFTAEILEKEYVLFMYYIGTPPIFKDTRHKSNFSNFFSQF